MRNLTGSRVAVVGGAGFLGSHCTDVLCDEYNCSVLVLDNLVTGKKEFIHPKARFEHVDITLSESYLLRLFQHHQIEYVFNWAAQPYIPVSFERPSFVVNTNFIGAINVLNAAHQAGCQGILQVSSAEIYGQGAECAHGKLARFINEETPVVPHSTYGASKAAVDFYVQCRWREAQVPCIALRQFNCVGERETHPYVIPEIIGQLYRSKESEVYLGNNSTRDFLYAKDAVRIAIELLAKGSFGQVYNSGSSESISIYELAELIGRLMHLGRVTIHRDPARVRPWEIWSLRSDNTKINAVLGPRTYTSLEEAILRTIRSFEQQGRLWSWEN